MFVGLYSLYSGVQCCTAVQWCGGDGGLVTGGSYYSNPRNL